LITGITKEAQYSQTLASIEKLIAKATDNRGFSSLAAPDKKELGNFSLLAEQYEDNILKILPLPIINFD
jgi:HTH-type transcriptional regulator / antitoxin HigA